MRPSRAWNLPNLLLVVAALALAVSSCAVPLPSPRDSHATPKPQSASSSPTAQATASPTPTTVPTNTPVILVLPTHTARPSATASQPPAAATTPASTTPPKPSLTPTRSLAATTVPPTRAATRTPLPPSPTQPKPSPTATRVLTQPSATQMPAMRVVPTATPQAKSKATAAPTATEPPHLVQAPTAATAATVTAPHAAVAPSPTPELAIGELLLNGNFEQGFDARGIGDHWQGFDKVTGIYGWSDETWSGLLSDGHHAQMMRIKFTTQPDQYIGIQQTFSVVKGQPYDLTIHGLIRSHEGSAQASNWGYRIEWGIDPQGRDSWQVVQQWYDTGWDDQPLVAPQYTIDELKATITPPEDTLTLFIRGWRKWGIRDREVDFVIDGVSLVGPTPYTEAPASLPVTGAPDYTWPLTAVAGLILIVIIFTLHKVRNLYANNR